MALEAINAAIPATIGGSADLTGSNNTKTRGQEPLTADNYGGRYIYYGIREFGMAAAMNGMALHGGVVPYGGTFLVFSDYCRPAIRLSALQRARVIYVMTHDSIGLGEDGPTHQPIEHLQALRAMPGLTVYRPADAVETAECWALALADDKPSVQVRTRADAVGGATIHVRDDAFWDYSPDDQRIYVVHELVHLMHAGVSDRLPDAKPFMPKATWRMYRRTITDEIDTKLRTWIATSSHLPAKSPTLVE